MAARVKVKRTCLICGCDFWGAANAKYCSDGCRKQVVYESEKYKPRKPKQMACKKCGLPFPSRWGAEYCYDCLHDGTAYMTQLLKFRAESDYDWDRDWIKCAVCGRTFLKGTMGLKYCSYQCAKEAQKRRDARRWEKEQAP